MLLLAWYGCPWCLGQRLKETCRYQGAVWSHACWGCIRGRLVFPGTPSWPSILCLIRSVLTKNHSEVKDVRKWILMLSGWGFIFPSTCTGVSLSPALVCFIGFLIKTHRASVVFDMKGYEGCCVPSALQWLAACFPPHLQSVLVASQPFPQLNMYVFSQLPFLTPSFTADIFLNSGMLTSSKLFSYLTMFVSVNPFTFTYRI